MSRVLVTGAGGFIGRHAVAALAARGMEVHGVGRRPPGDGAATWHGLDLMDSPARRALIRSLRPNHLLHLAWETRHGTFWQAPENTQWIEATVGLAEDFFGAGGERAVFAGSCAEYDWTANEDGVFRESDEPGPATAYGKAKQAAHERIAAMGLNYAWGRLFLLYGPFETEGRLTPSIIRAALAGRAAELREPDALRDFLHARDGGAAFAALLQSSAAGPVNIASGDGVTIRDVARRLTRLAAGPEAVSPDPVSPNPPRLVADVARLRDEVGFRPRFDLDGGLADTLAWWRAHCLQN